MSPESVFNQHAPVEALQCQQVAQAAVVIELQVGDVFDSWKGFDHLHGGAILHLRSPGEKSFGNEYGGSAVDGLFGDASTAA